MLSTFTAVDTWYESALALTAAALDPAAAVPFPEAAVAFCALAPEHASTTAAAPRVIASFMIFLRLTVLFYDSSRSFFFAASRGGVRGRSCVCGSVGRVQRERRAGEGGARRGGSVALFSTKERARRSRKEGDTTRPIIDYRTDSIMPHRDRSKRMKLTTRGL